jgi:hypothetical protein
VPALNLTSLMDVFTILVFFLVMNSGPTEVLSADGLVLPESVVETKPSETVVINIGIDEVLVQGEPVVRVADLLATDGGDVIPIMERLAELQSRVIGVRTQVVAESLAITMWADTSIPYSFIKKILSTCPPPVYARISLADNHKESAVAAASAATGTGI